VKMKTDPLMSDALLKQDPGKKEKEQLQQAL
jgi:hypothetical protein